MTQAPSQSSETVVRALCAVTIGAALPLQALFTARLVASADLSSAGPVLLGLAAGALAADLFTGLVHWGCDTWGSERTPVVGPALIHSFREHHLDPQAMLRHDWVFVNREPGIAAAVGLAFFVSPAGQSILAGHPFAHGFLCSFIFLAGVANQLHAWAHSARPPAIIRRLQDRRLILSPATHARHHRAPHDRGYCISSGWLNTPLDALGFWRGLERAVGWVTGAEPRATTEEDEGAEAAARR